MSQNVKANEFPEHIQDILQPTPSGTIKLLTVWDQLSLETQIQILKGLEDFKHPTYLYEKICQKALENKNAYIRYLSAKKFYFSKDNEEHQKLKQKVMQDESPLVRFSLDESTWGWLWVKDPEEFLRFPQEQRLAKIRNISEGGQTVAELFSNTKAYIEGGKISEMEVFEILADYVGSSGFKEKYKGVRDFGYDGYAEYSHDKDIEELWRLTVKLPERAAYPLLMALPADPPLEVIEQLNDHQLATLFYRDDIYLPSERKRIFFNPKRTDGSQASDNLRSAASCHNLDFTHDEFGSLLPNLYEIDQTETGWKFKNEDDEEKLKTLSNLGTLADGLSWVYLKAIHDFLFAVPVKGFHAAFEDAAWPQRKLKSRLQEAKKKKEDHNNQSQALELKLYCLAASAMPWNESKVKHKPYSPNGELDFLHDVIVEKDTWGTFIAFTQKWDAQKDKKTLEKLLPPIYDYDDDENENERAEIITPSAQAPSHDYGAQLKDIQQSLKRTKALAYIIFGLLIWLLLR